MKAISFAIGEDKLQASPEFWLEVPSLDPLIAGAAIRSQSTGFGHGERDDDDLVVVDLYDRALGCGF